MCNDIDVLYMIVPWLTFGPMPGLDVLGCLNFHAIAVAIAGVYCKCGCLASFGALCLRLPIVLPSWPLLRRCSPSAWVFLRCLNCIDLLIAHGNFDTFGASPGAPKGLMKSVSRLPSSHILFLNSLNPGHSQLRIMYCLPFC